MTPAFALRQRPDAAFEALYRRHVQDVYHYALAVLGEPSDAEDVTQTTFLNAYRAFHAGERPRKPKAWLRAIAHNVCRQRFRQAARRPHEVGAVDELPAPEVEETEAPTADDIARALRSLPFNQRAALVMRELEGRRQAEIAKELNLSESAVEALLFRARRAMREQLESSLTCGEAARAISRQLDSSLPRAERGALRAHLRECEECAAFARQARAQRGAFKALKVVPLPASLLSWSGGGSPAVESVAVGASAGTGAAVLGLKVAAGIAGALAVAGAGDVAVHQLGSHAAAPPHRATAPPRVAHTTAPGHAMPRAKPLASRTPGTPGGAPRKPRPVAIAGGPQRPVRPGGGARQHAVPGRSPLGRSRTSRPTRTAPRHSHPARPQRPLHPLHPSHPAHPAHPPRAVRPQPPAKGHRGIGATTVPPPTDPATPPKSHRR